MDQTNQADTADRAPISEGSIHEAHRHCMDRAEVRG
jgi:hypothetical protein